MNRAPQNTVLALVTILFFIFTASVSRADSVVLAASDYPPYEFANPDGDKRGLSLETIEAAFAAMNIDLTVEFLPWKRGLALATIGQYAGIFSCSYNDKRAQIFNYSQPIAPKTEGLFIRRSFSGSRPASFDDIKDMTIGGVLGWGLTEKARNAGAKVRSFRTEDLLLKNLAGGVIDYAVLNREGAEYQAQKLGLSGQLDFLEFSRKELFVCFSKKWPESEALVEQFDAGLSRIKSDGTHEKIIQKYR